MRRPVLILVIATAVTVLACGTALGAGFALYDWSARGNALGGAMTGRADDPEPEPIDPADLVVRLVNEATAARGAADRVDDGGLARLLTVVATARLLAADALARDLEVERHRRGHRR